MKIVGVNTVGYAEIRNFYGHAVEGFAFKKVQNIHKIPAFVCDKLKLKNHFGYYWNSFGEPSFPRCDMFHFFNTLSFGEKPWIVTFETSLPRWGDISPQKIQRGHQLLAGDSCKAIIAMSSAAKNIFKSTLNNIPLKESILQKLIVLHPPQKVFECDDTKWRFDDGIRLAIVGHDFFRKGGLQVLRVFDRWVQRGFDLKLDIFSKMQYGDYASHATHADLLEAMAIISAHPERIFLKEKAQNDEVLRSLKSAQLCLLPSFGETYGYSVLEAQACGCPVVTTDIRAFPEINSNQVGWLIPVNKDEFGNACLGSDVERRRCSNSIEEGLDRVFQEIFDDPSRLRVRGMLARERIQREHDPVAFSQKLKGLYSTACMLS